jgi:hypothetical protein
LNVNTYLTPYLCEMYVTFMTNVANLGFVYPNIGTCRIHWRKIQLGNNSLRLYTAIIMTVCDV